MKPHGEDRCSSGGQPWALSHRSRVDHVDPRHQEPQRASHRLRDRHRHEPVPFVRTSHLLGLHMSAQRRERRQTSIRVPMSWDPGPGTRSCRVFVRCMLGSLSWGMPSPFKRRARQCRFEPYPTGAPYLHTAWSPSTGTGGRHRPEPVVVFNRNSWSSSAGVRNNSQLAIAFVASSDECFAPSANRSASLRWSRAGTRRMLYPPIKPCPRTGLKIWGIK